MSILSRLKSFLVTPEPATVAVQEERKLFGGKLRYHLMHDAGHGWDYRNKCAMSGYYLGSTTEQAHARTLAIYHEELCRQFGKPGTIYVYTIAENGDCDLIDWRAKDLAAVA